MTFRHLAFSLAIVAALTVPALAADLKIGIGEDPDALDPDQSRTFVGEVVFAAMCDKLVNIKPDLTIIPQLATDWSWSADGKTLGSEESGGSAATATIVSLGSNTVTVAAPTLLTYPGSYTPGGETLSVKYQGQSGLSGVSQVYISTQTSFAVGILPITNLVMNLKVVNNSGFTQGAYSAKTVLTCS